MIRNLFFLSCCCLLLLSFCLDQKDKVSLLKDYYAKGYKQTNKDSLLYRKLFYKEFPSTFQELYTIYYWNEKTNKEAPLYFQANDHIHSFFYRSGMPLDSVLSKSIHIALGGHWEADAIGYFQVQLQEMVSKHMAKAIAVLNKKNDRQIKSFWFFYFDEPVTNKALFNKMQKVKDLDNRIYKLMTIARAEVVKKNAQQ